MSHLLAHCGCCANSLCSADADNQLRTASYEVLSSFVSNVGDDEMPSIAQLSTVILERLEKTLGLRAQIVSADDRNTLEEMQTSLAVVLGTIIQRLDKEIKPQADRIMHVLLQILTSLPPNSSVPDAIFGTVGSLANSLEEDFTKYMGAFVPFLYNALANQEEQQLCAMAIGLTSDIARSIGEHAAPYCDSFMNYLLNNLQSNTLSQQFKPAILQCFGDVAQSIGAHFETYLEVVMGVLQQASTISVNSETNYDMIEYVVSLREGIMDAYGGIIIAMRTGGKGKSSNFSLNLLFILTPFSELTCTLCSAYFWLLVRCQRRYQQDRGSNESSYGRSWVCWINLLQGCF
jgi:importin subunit beta-1